MYDILALDLATQLGWAHSSGESGTVSFHLTRGDSPGIRFLKFRKWLIETLERLPSGLLVYEQAGSHRSNAATHVAHGLISQAEVVASEFEIEITSKSPSEIKKFMLPKIPAKQRTKIRMIQAAENAWPFVDILDDNQADALCLLEVVAADLGVCLKAAKEREC